MGLDERKYLILRAIIDDYITTAVPVGSRTVSNKSGVGYSPATIRNEMSDLEDLGYLASPHISAGRIPSPKAYRLYVDRLLKVSELSHEEAEFMRRHIASRTAQVDSVLEAAAQALSNVTRYTALVAGPSVSTLRIKRVQLVQVDDQTALMVVVTSAGIIKDTLLRVPEGLNSDILHNLSETITQALADQPLSEIRQKFAEVFRDLRENRKLFASILNALETSLQDEKKNKVVVGGPANLLHYPEYSDVKRARNFLNVLESREKLYPLLRSGGSMEVSIKIGPEMGVPELNDCSIVTATYRVNDETTGTLGILGPTRMHYGHVIAALGYMGKLLTKILSAQSNGIKKNDECPAVHNGGQNGKDQVEKERGEKSLE